MSCGKHQKKRCWSGEIECKVCEVMGEERVRMISGAGGSGRKQKERGKETMQETDNGV